MTDEEFSDFQQFLSNNPNFGDVIPGTYGLRKVRWAGKNTGKRGGLRIIHFNLNEDGKIWLLDIYSKSNQNNVSNKQLKILREEVLIDD